MPNKTSDTATASKLWLIKSGGSILDNDLYTEHFCRELQLLHRAGKNIVIVHGGSRAIQRELDLHNVQATFKDGLRITSADAMNVVEMALCGIVNKHLLRAVNAAGIPAIALSGTDNAILRARQYSAEHERTGLVTAVNPHPIQLLLEHNYLPIIAPVAVNDAGQAMNINADWAAANLAIALQVDSMIYISDQEGILNKKGDTIPMLSYHGLLQLIDEDIVRDGMLTKTRSIIHALEQGVSSVHVINGKRPETLRTIMSEKEIQKKSKQRIGSYIHL